MPVLRRRLLSLCIALLAGGMTAGAMADGHDDDDKARQGKPASRERADSLSDSVRRIERATQGQILSAERVQFDGRDVNRVKVVDDRGRVRIYVDDPDESTQSAEDKPDPRTRRDDSNDPNL